MDKISKALQKLNSEEQKILKDILTNINKGNFSGLDLKKLKGRKDINENMRNFILISQTIIILICFYLYPKLGNLFYQNFIFKYTSMRRFITFFSLILF